MIILYQWIFVHLLIDFVLQTPGMVRHKRRLKARSWLLYLHCLLHGGLIYLLTPSWGMWYIGAIVAVSHYLIDLWKLNRRENLLNFALDQIFHLLILLLLWCIFLSPGGWIKETWAGILSNTTCWVIGTGYLVVTFPLSYLLSFATLRWRRQAEEGGWRSKNSLSEAGKWIGIFERILVYTFVITNHFEGIGFLIAAKSVLRFNDIKGSDARKETEYVLIGTLMSFAASILTGMMVNAATTPPTQ